MIDFAEIERLDFRGSESLARLDAILTEVAGYAETRTAAEIAATLARKVQADAAVASALAPFLAKFRALALPLLNDADALATFSDVVSIIGDERIGIYERLRARLLALPLSRRAVFAKQLLGQLSASQKPLGTSPLAAGSKQLPPTVGSWIGAFLQTGGAQNPRSFFELTDFKQLDDADDHTLRHLVHLVTLLAKPEAVETSVSSRAPIPVKRVEPVVPPAPPVNLPVHPEPIAAAPQPAAIPALPKAPAVPASGDSGFKGPSMGSVIARLHELEQRTGAAPATVAHLTPDDEQEIRAHSDRLASIDAGPNVHDTIGETIQRIVRSANLSFTDDNLQRRFETIVTSRLKDIRSPTDTLELLTRPEKTGGLGYDPALAEKIVTMASDEAVKFQDDDGVRQLVAVRQRAEAAPLPKPPRVPVAPPGPPPPVRPAPATPQPPVFRPAAPVPPARIPVAGAPSTMPIAAARTAPSERPTMSDIRGTSRLVGPIEELRSMTLVDFRRLGGDPIASVRRVYEKIQQLGRESFTKRAEGIRAWRESETSRLYVIMGQEGLTSSKNIHDVILTRQQSGQPALTEQEFMLVADLNRKLRF